MAADDLGRLSDEVSELAFKAFLVAAVKGALALQALARELDVALSTATRAASELAAFSAANGPIAVIEESRTGARKRILRLTDAGQALGFAMLRRLAQRA